MFAVIKTGGRQYSVKMNDCIQINSVPGHIGDEVCFHEILALIQGESSLIGEPFVQGAQVKAEILEQGKYASVISFKKRRRKNSRRTIGHRQPFTKLRISDIIKAAS